jgi:hypothetical protein
MISFFRKIRKKFADDNKPMKYLRYAVGEIVLVVIGILIALSINNWNEERKGNIKKKVYLGALIEDLKKDSVHLQMFIKSADSLIRKFEKFKTQMERSDATIDSIIKEFTSNSNDLLPPTRLKSANTTTFEALMSTGDIELFQRGQIEMLMSFYDEIEDQYYYVHDNDRRLLNLNYEFWNEFGFLTKENKESTIYKFLKERINEEKFLKKYDLLIYGYISGEAYNKTLADELLSKTNDALKTLSENSE